MSGYRVTTRRRLAAGLLALAALCHVQWLAACEVMPMAGAAAGCCAGGGADHGEGHGEPCDDRSQAHDCVTPFAKGAPGFKTAERAVVHDAGPDDLPCAVAAFLDRPGSDSAAPPTLSGPPLWPDGRHIYLSSSRLRL